MIALGEVLVDPTSGLVLSNSKPLISGIADFNAPVPADLSFISCTFPSQAVFLDLSGVFTLTNRLHVQIGT